MKVKNLYWALTLFHEDVVGPITETNGKEKHKWVTLGKDFTFGSIKYQLNSNAQKQNYIINSINWEILFASRLLSKKLSLLQKGWIQAQEMRI